MENDELEKNNNKSDDLDFVEKKSPLKIILVILLFIIGVGLIGGGLYYTFFMRMTPENYLVKVSETLTKVFDTDLKDFKNIKISNNSDNKNIKTVGNIDFNLDDKNNKLKIKYDSILDIEDETFLMNLDFLNGDTSILNGNMDINKDSIYLNVKDLYSKPIRLLKSDYNFFENLNKEKSEISTLDISKSLQNFIKYYFESLKEADISKEDISLTEVKYNYEINPENVSKIEEKFKELCRKDKDVSELFGNFDQIIFDENKTIKIEYITNRFTYEIISFKETTDDSKLEIVKDKNLKDNYNIIYDVNGDVTKGTLTEKNKGFLIKLTKDEKIISTLELNLEDGIVMNIINNEMDFNFSLKTVAKNKIRIAMKSNIKGENAGVFDFNADMSFDDNSISLEGLMTVSISEENLEMKINQSVEYTDEKPSLRDYKDAVDLENISESDIESITEKFMLKIMDSGLLSDLDKQNV